MDDCKHTKRRIHLLDGSFPPVQPVFCSGRQGEQCKGENRTPSVRPTVVRLPLLDFVGKGSDASPPQPPLRSAVPPSIQLRWQGKRCISKDISRYKRKTRVYRFDLSRVGPCVRPQSPYIWFEWSLLSKGLRGGKSRRLRVVSLLRRMLHTCNVRRSSLGGYLSCFLGQRAPALTIANSTRRLFARPERVRLVSMG